MVRWLYYRAWLSTEPSSVLFDLATARLVERQVLLPGVTILARLVARIRERANASLYRKLARMPSAVQRDRLKELLVFPVVRDDRHTTDSGGGQRSPLRRLNDACTLGVKRPGPVRPTRRPALSAGALCEQCSGSGVPAHA